MDIFTAIYFVAIVIEMIIRAPLNEKRKTQKMSERRVSTQEKILLGLLFLGMFLIPIIYASSNWLEFANYTLPSWAGWVGVIFIAGSLFVFWRAHADLGLNWSPSLEIREKHELITRGIYGLIRHPMYASQWLWVIAQSLLLQNWLAGPIDLIIFIPFYFLRVRAEEKMMLDSFGGQYRDYMERVGGVIPKFGSG
jgi:protein-S-isoprenylcysteine O-methyltransferase Ste14